MNAKLLLFGIVVILTSVIMGATAGGVKIPGDLSWWVRGPLVVLGTVIVIFSFYATDPAPAPKRVGDSTRLPLSLLPSLVPDTSFTGYVPGMSSRFVPRADVFDTARDSVLSHATVGLVGMGGAGKTLLATAIAHDPDIQSTFCDGIAWIEAGQQSIPTQLQETLATQLTGGTASFSTVAEGRNHLAGLLAGRAFLLVVDDIWSPEALNAVNVVGAPNGGLLFTTRDHGIANSAGATIREVDKLTLEQSRTLLARWTETDIDRVPQVADALCQRVGKLALGVALVGGMIKARGAQPEDWQAVMDLLSHTNIAAIANDYPPELYKHATVLASVTLSVDDLTLADQDRYRELAVFTGRGNFPPAAATALWAAAGCNAADTRQLLNRLTERSLTQRDEQGWIRLHDLQYEVVIHQLITENPVGLAQTHAQLLDGYRSQLSQHATVSSAGDPENPSLWVNGPDDGYFFQNLAYHLVKANHRVQLDRLLTDYVWLERKLAVAGISELIADYDHHQPLPADVNTVRNALRLSAHVLSHDPQMLAGQLVGRLLSQPAPGIRALVASAEPSDRKPWLRPQTKGSLNEPGGPLERILEGTSTSVESVAVTADSQHIISGHMDGTVQVWNLTGGYLEHALKCHTPWKLRLLAPAVLNRWLLSVATTPDGQHIISGHMDGTVRVWNLTGGYLEHALKCHTPWKLRLLAPAVLNRWPLSVATTPDGQHIISGHMDGTVRVWNLTGGHLEHTLTGPTESVLSVAITPDGQHIISGHMDGTVRVWNLTTGHLEHTLTGHTKSASSVATTPDGQHIISGSQDHTVRVWNLTTGHLEHTLTGHTKSASSVATTPDGQHIISGSVDQTVRVWNLTTGHLEHTLTGPTESVLSVAITPDGQHIISGSWDGVVRVWNLTTEHQEHTLKRHTESASSVAITPDGQHIISGSWDGVVRVWNLTTGHLEHTLTGHTESASSVAITPDGQHIISGSQDQTVRVWNLTTGHLEHTLTGHTESASSVATTPDGQHIISGSSDGVVRVWNLTTGHLEHTLTGHTESASSVATTPDGQHIISGSSDGVVRVWNLTTGHLEHTLKRHTGWRPKHWRPPNLDGAESVAVTPDGQHIISGSWDGVVRVWNLTGGYLEHTLKRHTGWRPKHWRPPNLDGVESVAVTPDGQHIISGHIDGAVRVWNLTTGHLEHTLTGHTRSVLSVAVTPDGQHVISGSWDGVVRVWNLTSGAELALWFTDATPIWSCTASPTDSSTYVYGDRAGRVVTLRLCSPEMARDTGSARC